LVCVNGAAEAIGAGMPATRDVRVLTSVLPAAHGGQRGQVSAQVRAPAESSRARRGPAPGLLSCPFAHSCFAPLMNTSADIRPVDLAIVHDGAGGLIFLLTDGAGLALQARAPLPVAGLTRWLQPPTAAEGPAAAAAFGHAMARALLPPPLCRLLMDDARPAGSGLRLLLDPALPPLPWPLAAEGGRSLAQRWVLSSQLLAGEAALPADDDIRQVTVLSCDLAGSTDLMHALGDEAYSERLVQYHRCVARIVQAHGGRADDPQGDDGFMCYFGYPVAREDAVARALRAALALAEALRALPLPVRLGLCTGRVVIRQGQPVGAAVHHAARLQALSAPGGVLVADSTRQIAGDSFGFCLVDAAARLKGFDEPVAVWRLLDERPLRSTEHFDVRPDLSPFLGREAELQWLVQHWQAAAGGQRRALRLVGEAGIGKSRLVREFRQWLAAAGHRTLECRCAPEHAGSAFQPLIDLLRRRLQVHEGDDPAVQLARLRALQVTTGAAADEAIALLGALLSLPAAVLPPLPPGESAEHRRQRTMALLERVALGLTDNAPVCLILEDVQWVDPSTGALMRRLIDGPPGQRVLLLLTQRSRADDPQDGRDGIDAASALPTLRLPGLPPAAARGLMQRAGGGAALDGELADWLAARADGVPLFIEESARMAAALALQRPGVDLARQLRDSVPAALSDLLTARLDQLPQAKRAAQLGSALGRSFPRALIEAVHAHPASPIRLPSLAEPLGALRQAGLLIADQEGGQPVWSFRHALLRDAAYQSLLARDRRALHAAIAAVLAAQFQPLCDSQPGLLPQHQELAGEHEAARAGWLQAAAHAAARSAHQEAAAHRQRAQDLTARLSRRLKP
jgi:class 3 adenylate cyclase